MRVRLEEGEVFEPIVYDGAQMQLLRGVLLVQWPSGSERMESPYVGQMPDVAMKSVEGAAILYLS